MDDKQVRIDSGLGTSIHNDCNKRLPNGNVTYTNRDKSYPDSLGKTDTRPCAIIGPDRVLPSTDSNDVYMKTIPVEPWEYPDNYRHPYDSIKMSEYHQTHNISPRQTFQENMQRIMVPPTYSSIKSSDETSLKNPKLNVPTEGKYCDVPYSINMLSSEPKSVRSDSAMPTINPSFPRGVQPHGWPGGGMQPLKPYQAHDYYHNSEYSNCPAPRQLPIVQQQRIVHDEIHSMYTDRLYQESNIRFKPYPTSKEKFPQPRYEYANTFQPPQTPKFDIQKSMHGHHYPMYPQGPYKYTVDRRYPEPVMETHPRALYPQHNAYRTHPIHPPYGPSPGNFYHNKPYPCPSDNPKSVHANKLSYDANNKIYLELENPRYKGYPSPDNFYFNDRAKLMRGDILIPGHTQMNSIGQQHYYKKDNLSIKNYDHSSHHSYREYRNIGSNPLARMPLQFSPNTVSISPCDSNTSNEPLMLGIPQEDCGYISQSSTASARSIDSNNSPADFFKRQGFNYTSTNPAPSRRENNTKLASTTDNKKGLNLSQFFQMWNEGDEEVSAPNNNEGQVNSNYVSPKPQVNNQEQLYILGSVPVSQEELSKYEHLQKVSKLPENIKGFNNIEILNQFEQLVESPGMNNLHVKNPAIKEYKVVPQTFPVNQIKDGTQRPVSPLDVEAKISQSVIHKEVGCNFEIKPCSPKVLSVDVAAPVHDVLGERFIEKVSNPVLLSLEKDAESKIEIVDQSMKATSCKMANGKFNQNGINSAIVKPLYPLQDLNANMGLCLASLPQLDSDIDLNLPEVNQQFIDANKIGTSCSSRQNVPLLENTHPNSTVTKKMDFNQLHTEGPTMNPEADKETIKLSKYRKTKKADNLVNITSSSSVSSAQRTDSVIIKNPENVKVCNESQNESLEVVDTIINKMTQVNNDTTLDTKNVITSENLETAIDFSVNRNEKTINRNTEVSKSTKESHFPERNINLSKTDNKKTSKIENSSDLTSSLNSLEQVNENLKNHDAITDFRNSGEENSNTNEETYEKLIKNKELPESETKFHDLQSENRLMVPIGRELNEVEEDKICLKHDDNKTKNKENYIFSDDTIINRCENLNNLPDLSFDLASISNEQSSHINYNLNKKNFDSKLETTVTGFISDTHKQDDTVFDGKIENMNETSNCTEQSNSENNKSKIVEDTSKIVDTRQLVHTRKVVDTNQLVEISELVDTRKLVDTSQLVDISELEDTSKFVDTSNQVDTSIPGDTNKLVDISKPKDTSKLVDLSFELADVSNGYSNDTCVNHNSNHKIDDLKLETGISGFTTDADIKDNTAVNGQIVHVNETSNCDEQTYSENKNLKLEESTSKLVDTIEKEIEDMDTDCGLTSNELSHKNSLLLSEDTSNDLFQENFNVIPSNSSVSVIKSSDSSRTIGNENVKSSIQSIKKYTSSSDYAMEENLVQSHSGVTFFSGMLTNDKDELSREISSDKNNLECQKQLLHDLSQHTKNENNRYLIEKDGNLESDIWDKIKWKDNKTTPAVDTNYTDCKLPIDETSCDKNKQLLNIQNSGNQINQAINIDNNNQDSVSQNVSALTYKSDEDSKTWHVYEKLNSAHYKRQFSPGIQNLLLHNTDNHILFKDKNNSKVNILRHKEHIDEKIGNSINVDSNLKIKLENSNENVKESKNDQASGSETVVEFVQTTISENVEVLEENHQLTQLVQNSEKVSDTVRKANTRCFEVSEFNQANSVRCPSPLTFARATKLLKRTSKRALSDSALRSGIISKNELLCTKRCKRGGEGLVQSPTIEANLCNIFRRNSISEIYNDGNVVILIDKELILTEDKEETEICFANEEEIGNNYDSDREIIDAISENLPQYEKELWVDDVACTETVFGDDVAEDIEIGPPSSPKDLMCSNYNTVNNESFMLCEEVIKNMENDVDVSKLNACDDSTYSAHTPYDYHIDDIFTCLESPKDSEVFTDDKMESNRRKAENILNHFEISTALFPKVVPTHDIMQDDKENVEVLNSLIQENETDQVHNNKLIIQGKPDCETYNEYSCTLSNCNYSSSPEVTSTTCEDKTPGIVLKISNHKRSKSSQLDDSKPVIKNKISYKLTEKKKYKPNFNSSGTLVTKAAQKYIPPIKITISDLKVKLPLPKNSLDKFKQLKKSKVEPKKIEKKPIKTYSFSIPREIKKPKPKFEDVLMSIDKFQYCKPKVKNKKTRDQIPKVVIKKNESGSHYTSNSSSSSEDSQSPDLTGRKWQPWVFIEKNTFIDKMALKHKVKAIYCRRKKSYVLAEKFRKYKSVYNAKFVISQPKSDDSSKGNLKYTIRLKHH